MRLKREGILGTILFHITLVFVFIYFGFTTPLPLPAEEGILINFGDSETGMGSVEPRVSRQQQQQVQSPPPQPVQPAEEQVLTQDYEEAPSIEASPQQRTEPQVETPSETTEKPKEEIEEEPEEPKREVNRNALYRGRNESNNQSNSEGNTYQGGNQGSATGSPDSDDRTLGLSLVGGGMSVSLSGRSVQNLPSPEYNQQVEGKVVVQITVDRNGNVTQAIPGVKGSNTLDSYLLAVAKQAALQAKFDRKPGAPAYQQGTITYNFKLN
jgi:TonB family protein